MEESLRISKRGGSSFSHGLHRSDRIQEYSGSEFSLSRLSMAALKTGKLYRSGIRRTAAWIICLDRFKRGKLQCSQKREAPVVEGRCIEEVYDALAERLVPTAAAMSNPNLKHIVGLAGPGAGQSTLASEVVRRVNKLWPQKASLLDSQVTPVEVAAVLPMDGYHLYRSQLDAMENPEEAHARRGAPWTFNPELLLKSLKTLRSQGSVYAPSFDHGVGYVQICAY